MRMYGVYNVFAQVSDTDLKCLYYRILEKREEGLRPRELDSYIRRVQEKYPVTFGESWRITERMFWEEAAKRFFERMGD